MRHLTVACLTHRRVPLELLARLPRGAAVAGTLRPLAEGCDATGVVVLSTCNRFEVYVDSAGRLSRGVVAEAIAAVSGLAPDAVATHLELHRDDDAVAHLFGVAAGLDSRVVGEEEILGQVRAAADTARGADTLAGELTSLFQWAVRAGRRARRTGGFGEQRSTAHHAVQAIEGMLGGVVGRLVVVVGNGQMATRTVHVLRARGTSTVVCARRVDAARSALPATQVEPLEALPALLANADAVVCATSSPTPVITTAMVGAALVDRCARPLPVVDLSIPRNVEPTVGSLPGVTVLDLDTLTAPDRDRVGHGDTEPARQTLATELDAYREWRCGQQIGGLIRAMVDSAEDLRVREVARLSAGTDSRQRDLLDEVTRRVVGKLVHEAVTTLRGQAARLAG